MCEVRLKQRDRFNILRWGVYNERLWGWGYQLATLLALGGLAWMLFSNASRRLREQNISSGLGFLSDEAGFSVGETPPLLELGGAFWTFLGVFVLGLGLTWLLRRYLAVRGESLGSSTWSLFTVVVLVGGLPLFVIYLGADFFTFRFYDETSSYGLALLTGLANTIKISLIGCILATVLGLSVGLARISSNWLVSKIAASYIEMLRNIPLLVQIFFWYKAVLSVLPGVRESLTAGVFILNNRGLQMPGPLPQSGMGEFFLAIVGGLVAVGFWRRRCRLTQEETGREPPWFWLSVAMVVVPATLSVIVFGVPFHWEFPELRGFNYQGGWSLSPEYTAMLLALVAYTSAFIAEIFRSGVQSVDRGQIEASRALGHTNIQTMRFVILPLSLRVMIPPLTSQYLNLTKNSSLGIAIGYPELVNVGGTTLNQSGQAIEVIAITMFFYLTLSLCTSSLLNWYNARVKLIER